MKKILIGILAMTMCYSCTNLDEELNDSVSNSSGSVSTASLLSGAYSSLQLYQDEQILLAAYVHPSDELIPPTRGGDWDDAGAWRAQHNHTWTNVHPHVDRLWRALNSRAFGAQSVLCAGDASANEVAEATFLRVFSDYMILDLFGKVPRRVCGEDLLVSPTSLLLRAEGIDVLIGELEAVMSDLPSGVNPIVANQNAAAMLLAKMYLNKGVYQATGSDGGAQAGPYTFSAADMTKVIENVDAITGRSLAPSYFDNFQVDNTNRSDELIFVSENTTATSSGRLRSRWFMTLHYNQKPSGWNGFTATTDLFNLFEPGDARLSEDVPEIDAGGGGFNAGFLTGAQLDKADRPVLDRQGNELVFSAEVSLTNSSEEKGYRVIKYIPDYADLNVPGNDYVFFRYADAMLLKAEAILRGGTSTETALDIVNTLRGVRNASALTSVTLSDVLDERSRELYWEGWKKQDQIRFGTYFGVWQEKSGPSTEKALLLPIPAEALASDPNLSQNPGY